MRIYPACSTGSTNMNFWRYLFPGFIIGPIIASASFNLAYGDSFIGGNQLGMGSLFIASILTSALLFVVDAMNSN